MNDVAKHNSQLIDLLGAGLPPGIHLQTELASGVTIADLVFHLVRIETYLDEVSA